MRGETLPAAQGGSGASLLFPFFQGLLFGDGEDTMAMILAITALVIGSFCFG